MTITVFIHSFGGRRVTAPAEAMAFLSTSRRSHEMVQRAEEHSLCFIWISQWLREETRPFLSSLLELFCFTWTGLA
jgi:hypothetical protein